jgi:hypothetical protein
LIEWAAQTATTSASWPGSLVVAGLSHIPLPGASRTRAGAGADGGGAVPVAGCPVAQVEAANNRRQDATPEERSRLPDKKLSVISNGI